MADRTHCGRAITTKVIHGQTKTDDIELGKKAYAEKRYEDALSHCDRILHEQLVATDVRLEVLDLKCSTLTKMGRYETASDVAKFMIRSEKSNARGYLRAASIAQQSEDYATAVEYLRHGRKRVQTSDKLVSYLLQQLQTMENLAQQNMVRQKPVDLMTVLPLELLEMVLANLEYAHIISMLRVSKSWKLALSRLEPLSTTVDFRNAKKQISSQMLNAALDRMVFPKSVALEQLSPSASTTMVKRLQWSKKLLSLEHLFVNDSGLSVPLIRHQLFKLRTLFVGLNCKIDISHCFRILSECGTIEEAVFKRVSHGRVASITPNHKIERLEIGNPFDLAAFLLPPQCFTHYPNLRILTVNGAAFSERSSWNLSECRQLSKLDVYASVIRAIRLPPSLEQWLWDGTEVSQFMKGSYADVEPLSCLSTVCLSGDNTLAALDFLQACQVKPGQLKRVGLHNRQGLMVLNTVHPPHYDMLESTQELSFESESLEDRNFPQFASRFPDLRILQLAAPRITGAFIADLLKRPENRIIKLTLKACLRVAPDTIEWARSRGVEVEVQRGAIEVRGGRRLREGWF